jgi:sarcosine oxidase, subunit gamma
MAEMTAARRTRPAAVAGSGWSCCGPWSAYSLRADLGEADARLAAFVAGASALGTALRLSLLSCRAVTSGEWTALWLGPDEQLLVGPSGDGPAMAQSIEAALEAVPHALVDVSHRQCAIELSGPLACAMLNSACPLDLDLAVAPVGFCTRTIFAKAEIVLWRRAESRFQLQTWRSFLPYVTGLLALAAAEQDR